MALTARNTRLAAIVIATAVAGSLAPGAAASSEPLTVNPSTGYVTPVPSTSETIQVNPSTGYVSGGQPSTAATPRSSEPPTAAEPSSGFDWASAAIGAAAGAGLVLALTLSVTTAGVGAPRRPRRAG
jgi:hypothetical protein